MPPIAIDYPHLVSQYQNTAQGNDHMFALLNQAILQDPLLLKHRRFIQDNQLGFGEDAFHPFWQALMLEAHRRFPEFNMLEIGVFKGQVISLWNLLARHHRIPARIHAISPLEGQPQVPHPFMHRILYHLWPPYRERIINGDFYQAEDYHGIISKLFQHFQMDFTDITLFRGYSTAPAILSATRDLKLHILYIDGDHTYRGACADIENFAPLVVPGGWLIMDDAGADLPGTTFWKGHPSVSRACTLLPTLGFENVLNVGHNRVFQRRPPP
jgi:hypothetical protein